MLKARWQKAVIILVLFIMSCKGKRRYQQLLDPKVNEMIVDEQGYERIRGKEDATDDTERKYLPDKVQNGMNLYEYALERTMEMGCTINISFPRRFNLYSGKFYNTLVQKTDTNPSVGKTIFGGPSTSIGSDVTTSAPTNIADSSQSSEKTSHIEWTRVFHTAGTIIILIILAVSIPCIKRYVDMRLRTLTKATENEQEPLQIPMEDFNVNQTPVAVELQESDHDNHNGNVDSSAESAEGQCESETEGKTMGQSNDYFITAGQSCSCRDSPWKKCNKRNMKTRMALVKPHMKVNEMPHIENVEDNVLVDEYSNVSSSISHHPESHGSTNTEDDETTHVKSVYSNEQVSSTVEQTNEADGTCFEESQQGDVDNEDTTDESDLFRADSRYGRTHHDEDQMIAENEGDVNAENEGDVNEVWDTEAA